ncbi:MAG: PhzF family phenazine biosynthesis protein [Verrucomicrobiota bacterium]|nr:PhzF family phenazine biosynthesis protein [Verrucomicrobiota bacterium]
MKIPIYQIDAFADKPFEGNSAAVCPLDTWLPDETLQAIAKENNLAETAFFVKEEGIYGLRWFTPKKEVDLCGHATLAAAHALLEGEYRDRTEIVFESKSGILRVLREEDDLALDFPVQRGIRCEAPKTLINGLGFEPSECYWASDYLAVFDASSDVAARSPDFRALAELDLRGVIVTAPGEYEDFVSRFFAPKFGIDEDPITGSAHCTLAPDWADKLGKDIFAATYVSKRTGLLI